MSQFYGQPVVVITGASAGVGRAVAHEYARRGWAVALLARGVDGLEGAAREVERLGGRALPITCDVSDAEAVEYAAQRIEAELGPIDVWVNNAMTTIFSRFGDIEPDEYRRATEVTYLGFVWGTMSALRRMKERGHGVIIQVGSALAYRAIPLQAPYCGAKHAIRGFTDSVRTELLHDQIPVEICMVQLPAMNTVQFEWCRSRLPNRPQPVPPIYDPAVAARAIYWVSQHPRREFAVGFNTAYITFLNSFAPGIADRYLAKTGFKSQQTGQRDDPDRPDNLFEPVPGDHGTRGSFTDRSIQHSRQVQINKRRNLFLAALALGAVGLIAASGRRLA